MRWLRRQPLPANYPVMIKSRLSLALAALLLAGTASAQPEVRTAMTDVLPEAQKEALNARIPMGRMGEAGDIGAAVVFLASKEAGYVTGQTLHVNGGMAMFA